MGKPKKAEYVEFPRLLATLLAMLENGQANITQINLCLRQMIEGSPQPVFSVPVMGNAGHLKRGKGKIITRKLSERDWRPLRAFAVSTRFQGLVTYLERTANQPVRNGTLVDEGLLGGRRNTTFTGLLNADLKSAGLPYAVYQYKCGRHWEDCEVQLFRVAFREKPDLT